MDYDVTAKDDSVMISIPGRVLHDLLSLSQGYTQSQGRWINKNGVHHEVQTLLYEQGYEVWGPTLLAYERDDKNNYHFVPRKDLTL